MRQQSRDSIVILFIVATLALNYPFLELFDRAWALLGVPLLYLYLYLVWFVVIILLIVVVEHSEIHEPEQPTPSASASDSPSAPEPPARTRGAPPESP